MERRASTVARQEGGQNILFPSDMFKKAEEFMENKSSHAEGRFLHSISAKIGSSHIALGPII